MSIDALFKVPDVYLTTTELGLKNRCFKCWHILS
jgi:hypothetical protein